MTEMPKRTRVKKPKPIETVGPDVAALFVLDPTGQVSAVLVDGRPVIGTAAEVAAIAAQSPLVARVQMPVELKMPLHQVSVVVQVGSPGLPLGFVDVETTPLVELDGVPPEDAPLAHLADFDQAVSGALVKVVPVLRRSERDGFVDADARRRVLAAGARACVIRPVIVPDVVAKSAPERARLNPRDELRRWVAEHMPATRDEMLDALLTHCDGILSEVGL